MPRDDVAAAAEVLPLGDYHNHPCDYSTREEEDAYKDSHKGPKVASWEEGKDIQDTEDEDVHSSLDGEGGAAFGFASWKRPAWYFWTLPHCYWPTQSSWPLVWSFLLARPWHCLPSL